MLKHWRYGSLAYVYMDVFKHMGQQMPSPDSSIG